MRILGLLFFASAQAFATSQLTAERVLGAIHAESLNLMTQLGRAETSHPVHLADLEQDLGRSEWHGRRLRHLFRSLTDPEGQVTFTSRWPRQLEGRARRMAEAWHRGLAEPELQDAFHQLHDAYRLTMASAYVYLELTKRRYLLVPQMVPVDPAVAQAREILEPVHATAQRLFRWMHIAKAGSPFRKLVQGPVPLPPFEQEHGQRFYYLGSQGSLVYPWGRREELVRYLASMEPPPVLDEETEVPVFNPAIP